ncbi:MAG TPA: substrate-binding domain-containing protein, partial [Caldilineaceae bacterium]|nr:substrate-binding domain-containing protein [Caldilineaceae bacterium]
EEEATTLDSSAVETGDVERSGNDPRDAAVAAPSGETISGGGDEAAVVNLESPAVAPAESVASLALTGMAAVLYNAENNTVSENDDILATIVGSSPTTVGFFGYAYYLKHQDRLRTIAIRLPDGQLVGPNATSVANGLYPLARPLYLYTSPAVLREKPDVERFIGCYLSQLPQVMNEVGYLLPSRNLFAQAIQSFNASCQECRREVVAAHPLAENVPICDAGNTAATSIAVVGSSTVQPLSERMASVFAERGFRGTIEVDGSGTGAGFRNFCTLGRGDIVDASRSVTGEERANCSAIGRALVPFPIAVDALAIVVSVDNAFLQEASPEELQQIFAYARQWSDVNPTWPNEPIARAIPGAQSGTFDYFVEAIMEGNALRNLAALQANPLSDQSGLLGASTPTSTPVGSGAFLNNAPDVRLGFVEQDVTCTVNTRLAALIMERKYGLRVTTSAYPDVDALFKALSAKDPTQRVDLTFCYRDPTDRTVRQRYFSYTDFIGSGYLVDDSGRYVIVSNSNVKAPLERSNACLYQFLNRMNWEDGLTFNGGVLQAQEVPKWYEENLVHIDRWASCD